MQIHCDQEIKPDEMIHGICKMNYGQDMKIFHTNFARLISMR